MTTTLAEIFCLQGTLHPHYKGVCLVYATLGVAVALLVVAFLISTPQHPIFGHGGKHGLPRTATTACKHTNTCCSAVKASNVKTSRVLRLCMVWKG